MADELAELVPTLSALLGSFDDAAWTAPSPNVTGTLGEGVEALWSDMVRNPDPGCASDPGHPIACATYG